MRQNPAADTLVRPDTVVKVVLAVWPSRCP
jgi:hypothetical protein